MRKEKNSSDESAILVAVTGDLVLDEPDAGHWLSGLAPVLHRADIAIGHLEVPHSRSTHEATGDIPAPGAPPENLVAIAEAGFDMISLAGNHIADCGAQGIADTIAGLDRNGLMYCGAGHNLATARRPAIAVAGRTRVALLSYNCVGPESSWATDTSAGCAFLPVVTEDGSPVSPQAKLGNLHPQAREILLQDVSSVRQQADFVVVSLHKGIVHTPAKLAAYEREAAKTAIECGADAVISHHAHIVRGVEFHQGRPIFHGLGNGCVVTRALSPDQDHPGRREWAEKRRTMFGFEPDPAYVLAPFHPEAVNAFIGQITFHPGMMPQASLVPVHVEAPGRPTIATGTRVRAIASYVEQITLDAGLPPICISDCGRIVAAA